MINAEMEICVIYLPTPDPISGKLLKNSFQFFECEFSPRVSCRPFVLLLDVRKCGKTKSVHKNTYSRCTSRPQYAEL